MSGKAYQGKICLLKGGRRFILNKQSIILNPQLDGIQNDPKQVMHYPVFFKSQLVDTLS